MNIYPLRAFVPWYEIGADVVTMLGFITIVFLFIKYYQQRDERNLTLMGRCIDNYRKWSGTDGNSQIDFFYLEFLNEELFYFQNNMIEKRVAVEWIEGMLDTFQVYFENKDDGENKISPLNVYNQQTDIRNLPLWEKKQFFFRRIDFFLNSKLDKSFVIPSFTNVKHEEKKRALALELYKQIRKYRY